MKKLFLGGVVAAAALGACVAQPGSGCLVQSANAFYGLPAYWMKYSKVEANGACGELVGEEIGFQKFYPATPGPAKVAIRAHDIGAPFSDAEQPQRDPADAQGLKVNASGTMPVDPNADKVCALTDFVPAEQNYAEAEAIPDAGLPAKPAVSLKYEWSKLEFVNTPSVPGTVFSGRVKRTEDGCEATFDAFWFWPAVQCADDLDCAPFPTPDAGILTGSGISPSLSPASKPVKCNVATGYCELGLSLAEIKALKD